MKQFVLILLTLFVNNLVCQEIGERYIATGVSGNLMYGQEYLIKDFRTTKKGKEKILLENTSTNTTAEIKKDKLLTHCTKLITIGSYKVLPIPIIGITTIAIKSNLSDNENFLQFGKFLGQNGFSFELRDNGFLLLKTVERTVKKDLLYKLNISFSDSLIFINAIYQSLAYSSLNTPQMNMAWIDWSYATLTTDLNYKAYQAFYPILEKFEKEILYVVKN